MELQVKEGGTIQVEAYAEKVRYKGVNAGLHSYDAEDLSGDMVALALVRGWVSWAEVKRAIWMVKKREERRAKRFKSLSDLPEDIKELAAEWPGFNKVDGQDEVAALAARIREGYRQTGDPYLLGAVWWLEEGDAGLREMLEEEAGGALSDGAFWTAKSRIKAAIRKEISDGRV